MAGLGDSGTITGSRAKGTASRWIDELAKLLPQRAERAAWRALLLASHDGLEVYLPEANGKIRRAGFLRTDGTQQMDNHADRSQLARLARVPAGLVLRLRRDEVIEKTISVPAEAQDVIAPIVQNQIEMISPWPVDKALYDWDVGASPVSSSRVRQLNVNVAVAGKAVVERWLTVAAQHGLAPHAVDFGDDAATASGLNFLRQRNDVPVRGRSLVKGLLLLLGIGALVSGGVGLMQAFGQRDALTWVEERASAAERRAAATHKVTGKAARLEARYRLASDEKYRNQPMIGVLEALSRTLPDGTWLSRFEIREGNIRIVGHSQDATALIGLLEASPFFSGARFAAPVTPGAGGQQFVIEARAVENLSVATLLKPRTGGRTNTERSAQQGRDR